MPTPILYTPKPGAKWADFGSGDHPLAWYASLVVSGFDGVILDTYSAQASDVQYALQAGLGVMFVQGYDPAVWADPAQAAIRAQQAIDFPRSVGYPAGATTFLDFESCATSFAEAAAWINAWAQAVRPSGYFPGIYVGAPEPLSGLQLYGLLTGMLHYWESESTVPMVAHRGYQIIQEQGNVLFNGILIDIDRIQMDDLGGLPHGMILPKPSSKPASPSQPSPIQTADARIAQLQQTLAASQAETAKLQAVLARVQADVKGE